MCFRCVPRLSSWAPELDLRGFPLDDTDLKTIAAVSQDRLRVLRVNDILSPAKAAEAAEAAGGAGAAAGGRATTVHGARGTAAFLSGRSGADDAAPEGATHRSFVAVARACHRLVQLEAPRCDMFTDKVLRSLAHHCHYLETLVFSACPVTDRGVRIVVNRCLRLRDVSVADCNITDLALEDMAAKPGQGQHSRPWRRISFRRCPKLTDKGVSTLLGSPSVHFLEDMVVAEMPGLTPMAFVGLANADLPRSQPAAESGSVQPTPAALRAQPGSPASTQTHFVTLRDLYDLPQIPDQLNRAPGFRYLTAIDVRGFTSLTDRGATFVADNCPAVKSLSVAGNSLLTNAAMRIFGDKCKFLERLNISGCDSITDQGLLFVCGRLDSPVTHLDITGCFHIGDVGVAEVAWYCSRLRQIRMTGLVDVTDVGVTELLCRCPNLSAIECAEKFIVPSSAHRRLFVMQRVAEKHKRRPNLDANFSAAHQKLLAQIDDAIEQQQPDYHQRIAPPYYRSKNVSGGSFNACARVTDDALCALVASSAQRAARAIAQGEAPSWGATIADGHVPRDVDRTLRFEEMDGDDDVLYRGASPGRWGPDNAAGAAGDHDAHWAAPHTPAMSVGRSTAASHGAAGAATRSSTPFRFDDPRAWTPAPDVEMAANEARMPQRGVLSIDLTGNMRVRSLWSEVLVGKPGTLNSVFTTGPLRGARIDAAGDVRFLHLRSLVLNKCRRLTDAALESLAVCPHLERLDLTNCVRISDQGLIRLATALDGANRAYTAAQHRHERRAVVVRAETMAEQGRPWATSGGSLPSTPTAGASHKPPLDPTAAQAAAAGRAALSTPGVGTPATAPHSRVTALRGDVALARSGSGAGAGTGSPGNAARITASRESLYLADLSTAGQSAARKPAIPFGERAPTDKTPAAAAAGCDRHRERRRLAANPVWNSESTPSHDDFLQGFAQTSRVSSPGSIASGYSDASLAASGLAGAAALQFGWHSATTSELSEESAEQRVGPAQAWFNISTSGAFFAEDAATAVGLGVDVGHTALLPSDDEGDEDDGGGSRAVTLKPSVSPSSRTQRRGSVSKAAKDRYERRRAAQKQMADEDVDKHPLKHLSLCGCPLVTDAGVTTLLPVVPRLHSLNLSKTRVSDQTVEVAARICTALRSLNVEGCRGDDTFTDLVDDPESGGFGLALVTSGTVRQRVLGVNDDVVPEVVPEGVQPPPDLTAFFHLGGRLASQQPLPDVSTWLFLGGKTEFGGPPFPSAGVERAPDPRNYTSDYQHHLNEGVTGALKPDGEREGVTLPAIARAASLLPFGRKGPKDRGIVPMPKFRIKVAMMRARHARAAIRIQQEARNFLTKTSTAAYRLSRALGRVAQRREAAMRIQWNYRAILARRREKAFRIAALRAMAQNKAANRAATEINRIVRGSTARARAKRVKREAAERAEAERALLSTAATKIQRIVRGRKYMAAYRILRGRLLGAVSRIQSVGRMYLVRRAVRVQRFTYHRAARKLQRAYRAAMLRASQTAQGRRDLASRVAAYNGATGLQSVFRGMKGRAKAAKRKALVLKIVRPLQRKWRVELAKREVNRRRVAYNAAATLLQKCLRGQQGRKRAEMMRQRHEKEMKARQERRRIENNAANLIQRNMRAALSAVGGAALRRVIRQTKRTIMIQKRWRGFKARRAFRLARHLRGARKLFVRHVTFQALWRLHLLRMGAAQRIQMWLYRHHKARQRTRILAELRYYTDAAQIQRMWRGFLVRTQIQAYRISLHDGANQLQRLYRGHLGRRKAEARAIYVERYKAASKIAAMVRGKLTRDYTVWVQDLMLAAALLIERAYIASKGRQKWAETWTLLMATEFARLKKAGYNRKKSKIKIDAMRFDETLAARRSMTLLHDAMQREALKQYELAALRGQAKGRSMAFKVELATKHMHEVAAEVDKTVATKLREERRLAALAAASYEHDAETVLLTRKAREVESKLEATQEALDTFKELLVSELDAAEGVIEQHTVLRLLEMLVIPPL